MTRCVDWRDWFIGEDHFAVDGLCCVYDGELYWTSDDGRACVCVCVCVVGLCVSGRKSFRNLLIACVRPSVRSSVGRLVGGVVEWFSRWPTDRGVACAAWRQCLMVDHRPRHLTSRRHGAPPLRHLVHCTDNWNMTDSMPRERERERLWQWRQQLAVDVMTWRVAATQHRPRRSAVQSRAAPASFIPTTSSWRVTQARNCAPHLDFLVDKPRLTQHTRATPTNHADQSPISLYTTLDAECGQRVAVVGRRRQHLVMTAVAKCCQQQTDDGRLWVAFGDGGRYRWFIYFPG